MTVEYAGGCNISRTRNRGTAHETIEYLPLAEAERVIHRMFIGCWIIGVDDESFGCYLIEMNEHWRDVCLARGGNLVIQLGSGLEVAFCFDVDAQPIIRADALAS